MRARVPRQYALFLGYGGVLLGAYFLHEAYENRGRKRPLFAHFLP